MSTRAQTLLISALGGEGGGVLKDWVVTTAHAAGLPVQATSIPGVAQRTGATTYYVEIYPVRRDALNGKRPVLGLTPTAGQVDVFIGSELMEAARQMQAGMVSQRSTFIASTHRVYATAEKMAMGDGRFDSAKAIEAAHALTARAILFDMEAETKRTGTVISAVMFGALIGSDALPLKREDAEAAIKAGGKGGVQAKAASLAGFAAGFDAARGSVNHTALKGASTNDSSDNTDKIVGGSDSPANGKRHLDADQAIALGFARCTDYQDAAYAKLYEERVATIRARDAAPYQLTAETARFLALWMCYEDVARVADLKSRAERFDGIRSEAGAQPDQTIKVVEFFKPGYGEVADQLPPALATPIRNWAKRHNKVAIFENGILVESTSFTGYAKLRAMAALRHVRRASSRYALEQSQIERWLAAIETAPGATLALEIALCGRLIKGYSDTHQRGKENFLRILETLVESGSSGSGKSGSGSTINYSPETRTAYVRAAREAALADPEGRKLDGSLEEAGIAPRPIKTHKVTFYPRSTESGR